MMRPQDLLRRVQRGALRAVTGWIPGGLGSEDVVVVAVVQDAAAEIQAFLDHHLSLGVRGVVLVDLHSTDETVELARRYSPVLILQPRLPLLPAAHRRGPPRAARALGYFSDGLLDLLWAAARSRLPAEVWRAELEVSERLEYPHSERLSLGRLARYLNERGAGRVDAVDAPGRGLVRGLGGRAADMQVALRGGAPVGSLGLDAHAAREGRDGKVFCIGFHKTGTTSMGTLLRALGYRAVSAYRTRDPAFVADLAAGRLDDLFRVADRAQAFEDNPWPLFYRALDARYPGSRFILTVRDPDRWLKSLVNHFGGQEAPDSPMRAFIYGPGRGDPRGHEAVYRARFEAHRAEVEDYFAGRPKDLLVVDIAEPGALSKVCAFLGHAPPFDRMPHENRRLT
ncbi:MAG: hypothetical protein KC933_23520 [Myxococcales bacterium]|nr:hypothetical protein [Myxococcales bacterium]